MIRELFYLVCVFMIVGLIGPAAAQEVDMEIGFAVTPPVLDGEVDEIWADASEQYFVPLEDPADGSGIWKVLYDAENLYVLVDITDDSLQNDSASSWQDDSVEIYFDGGNTKLSTPLSGDDHQYTFGWTADDIQGTNITGATEGIEQAQVTTDTGWRIEIKMPWLSIWGVAPQAGDLIGIDCYYNDDDDGGDSREGKMLSFSAVEGWNDASQWGTAVLAAEPEPGPQIITVFSEDFEGLPLGPNVDEALAGDAVWTDTPPAGWIVDESGIPGIGDPATDGVTEWAGWAFADKAWWTQTAGDQDRSLFVLGSGTVAIADPDEWDDADHTDSASAGWYKTFLSSPAIDISGCKAGTVQLKFDSSWRPEFDDDYHQTASITASYDGAEPVVVLLWESDEASPNYKPYATNETVVVDLGNPAGAKSIVLTFGLYDAGNDWWWAIDNVEVSGMPLPEPVDPGTEGLVAHYAFENDTTDSSGNGLDGVVVGDPAFVGGVEGMALDFNGDDYVDCGGAAEFSFADTMTVSAWVNIRSVTTAWMSMVNKGENAWRLGVNNQTTGIHYAFSGGTRGWQAANTATELNFDQWYHVAATYDTNVGALVYIDGVVDASNPNLDGIDTNAMSLLLGENPEATGRLFDGMLDEVMIYGRALSEAEILYLAGKRPKPVDPGTDGLVAHYAFENDTTDSSGNGLDGVVVGDPAFVDGVEGMALDFNGDDYVDCGGVAEFSFTDAMTVSGWVNIRSRTTAWMAMIAKGENAWRVGVNNQTTGIHFGFTGGTRGWQAANTATELAFDEWYHVAATYDTSVGAQVYIDGVLDASNPDLGGIPTNEMSLLLGENPEATGRFFDGMLDEVKIYGRALSEDEIRFLAGQ